MNRAFTLVELLAVIAIMGLLGTLSVGGYRAMQRGMADRGVMQNVNHLVRAAYQRAQIDRQPVKIYFWNETVRARTDDENEIVVGKAVAIRRYGRITKVTGSYLIDEFSDLDFMRAVMDEDDETEQKLNAGTLSKAGNGTFLYRIDSENGFRRSTIAQSTVKTEVYDILLNGGRPNDSFSNGETGDGTLDVYGFYMMDPGGITWKPGDAYGFEFANIELPHNYLFGNSYSSSATDPIKEVKVMSFSPGQNSGSGATGGIDGDASVTVCSLQPNAAGQLTAKKVGTSDNPTNDL